MANQSSYFPRNGPRTYMSSLPSINSPEPGNFHGHSREMRPPLPPQPMEIADLNLSRTLPSLSATGSGNLDLLPPPGYGDIPYGNPNISKIYQQFPTDGQIMRPAQDPIQDWYSTDGPWTHIPKVMPPNNVIPEGRFQSKQTGSRNHIASGSQYRLHNPPESGSFHYGVPVPHSDSGYGTRRSVANTSVFSGDVPDRDQDCQSLTGHVESFQPFIGSNEDLQQRDVRPFDPWTSVASIQESRGLICPTCHKPVKTQSEMKKHELRHTKPFHCDTPGCNRTEGFSTPNDLDRHRKSKHPECLITSSGIKKYRCLVEGCKSREKSWPRLDNFKSHLRRVHQSPSWTEQVMEEMLKKAEYTEHSVRGPMEEISVEKHTLPDLAQPPTSFAQQDNLSSPRNGSFMPYPKAIEPAHDLIAPKGPHAGLYESRSTSSEDRFSMPEAPPQQTIVKPGDVIRNYVPDPPKERASLVPAGHHNPVSAKQDEAKSHAAVKTSPPGKALRQTNMSAAIVEQLKHALSDLPATSNHDVANAHLERSQPSNSKDAKNASPGSCPVFAKAQDSGIAAQVLTPEGPKDSQVEEKALELLDIISKLGFTISKDPTHASKQQNAGSVASHKSENQVTCQTCGKFTGRPCELKKHMKRHEKPYGCTFLTCNKVFGSKNDWKRHENSQHFHLEIWRCSERTVNQNACTKVCYRRMTFQDHLKKDHQVEDEALIKLKTDRCRIGRNCQSRFWCGFCVKSIDLAKKGLDAWTERFDHIDDHFMGRGIPKQSIREWIPVDSDKPKGDAAPENGFENSASSSSDKESSSNSEHESSGSKPDKKGDQTGASTLDSEASPSGSKRRNGGPESNSRASKKPKTNSSREWFINCCECQMPHNPRLHSSCSACVNSHRWCDNCTPAYDQVVSDLPLP